ncbi:MAG: 2-C-methyl-D-erythritol 4-phosphate cytidylyltransferase [Alphaproteobacteria bacterium]|nr:2-C-methyl-D-erythritol 4-phosphate cytidylyltransferase [Rickettsiales bacterium]
MLLFIYLLIMIIAVIPAGGFGERMDNFTSVPKQYTSYNNFHILRKSIEAFINHPDIYDVIVAIRPQDIELYKKAVDGLNILPPVLGGSTRKDSVYNALEAIEQIMPDKVLIHDAVRPFVSKSIISSVIMGLQDHKAVIPCVSMQETVKIVKGVSVISTIDRTELWNAQTPQGFHYKELMKVYRKHKNDSFSDEATIMERAGINVVTILGSKENIKITDAQDYIDLQRKVDINSNYCTGNISNLQEDFFTGSGIDIHQIDYKSKKKKITLCGIEIPNHSPLKGNSDADVALHALTDAILGSISEGDIGTHFGNTEEELESKNSEVFVKSVNNLLLEKKGRIINVDITIICQTPRLEPYKDAMRANVARMLGIKDAKVNIKGKTAEKLGFIGRKEGIVSQVNISVAMPKSNATS